MTQYYPIDSVLHRLDPRAKIVLLLCLFAGLFLCDGAIAYGVMVAFALALVAASRVPVSMVLASLKPIVWLLLFTLALHWWSGTAALGVMLTLRLVLLLLMSSLLTFTTSPLALTDAIESLLSPFRHLGVPAHELAMMTSIALRFVPTLQDEMDTIIKAQESRGADLSSGNPVKRLRNFVPILVPLFVNSFRRADELAVAMESRCYRGGEGRTRWHELRVRAVDGIAAAITAMLLLALVAASHCGAW